MAGNKRFIDGNFSDKNRDIARRNELSQGQHPFAAVICCSDSRVCPEILFDQGLGDIFVIRVAGNIADDVVMGSLEYAIEHLHVPLVFVLGHSKCGAVTAAVDGGEMPGHIGCLTSKISPAVEKAKGMDGDHLYNCINMNVKIVVEELKEESHILAEFLEHEKVSVVAGVYDLETGIVKTID
jgi:carbonic anhydrase